MSLTALPQHLEFSSVGHQVHLEQLLLLQLQVAPKAYFHVMILTWSCAEREPSTRLACWMLAFHLQE
jgi:hypothetical protein